MEVLHLLLFTAVCMLVVPGLITDAVMSIPPLLSSSPPPLEENGSISNDDFGDFSDYASVGAVSSATSVNESSSTFKPIDSAELSSGHYVDDTYPKPDIVQEVDEWSAFDRAVVQPVFETTHSNSANSFCEQTLLPHELSSNDACVGENPPVDVAHESCTRKLPNISPSTSPVIISEQSNSENVSDSCSDNENVHDEELAAGKFDSDFCADLNTLSVDMDLPCSMEEVMEDEESFSVDDNRDHELDNNVHLALQENDIEGYNNFNFSSTGVISDRSECVFPSDNQPSVDENFDEDEDFADNFQSFSSSTEFPQHTEAQPSVVNTEEITSRSIYLQPEGTSYETDFASSVQTDSATAAARDEVIFINHPLTYEQMLTTTEEVDDDFDDFEEFVAAKPEPTKHLPIADSITYQWNASENTSTDSDGWAAFQDSHPPQKASLSSEVVTVTSIQQAPATYSDRLSKVHNV